MAFSDDRSTNEKSRSGNKKARDILSIRDLGLFFPKDDS